MLAREATNGDQNLLSVYLHIIRHRKLFAVGNHRDLVASIDPRELIEKMSHGLA